MNAGWAKLVAVADPSPEPQKAACSRQPNAVPRPRHAKPPGTRREITARCYENVLGLKVSTGYLRHPGQYVVAPATPSKNSRIVPGGSSKNRLRQARQYARGSFAKNVLNASRKYRLGAMLLISAIAATSESSVGGDGQRVNQEIPGM
jgi:hypothetical protein